MKKREIVVLNNKGASLVMVIVCFAFIAILGSTIVAAALNNLEMKQIDQQSKQTFYNAEAALDEIKVSLSEDVYKHMATAYRAVLEKYSTTAESARDALFENEFTTAMATTYFSGSSSITGTVFNNYLKETKYNATTGNGAIVSGNPTWNVYPGDSITFKNVVVIYKMNGFSTSITTDVKVMYPSIALVSQVGSMEKRPYLDYALIANTGLWITTSGHVVSGNIYAGSRGINLGNESNKLTIDDCTVITAGDITVKDKAQLIIEGTGCEVWANNLVTSQTDKMLKPAIPTVIDIDGSCFIRDDLVLNAFNSKVKLTGEYYGYSNGYLENGTSSGIAEDNSAIMVNSANAVLDLAGLSELKVAGRVFINLDKLTYDVSAGYGANTGSNSNILTGESLTIKGAQMPYLVPAEHIKVGHNPVTWSEYQTEYAGGVDSMVNTTTLLASDIFVSNLVSNDQSSFSYYLNAITPVKKAFYKFGGDSNVVYYYLNFSSEEKATIFYKNYNLCYHNKIYNGFDIGSIVVNSTVGSVMTSGNLITYSGDIQVKTGDTKNYVNNYASKYDNLIHTMQKNVTSTKSIYENIVNIANVETDTNASTKQVFFVNDATDYVNIINNDDKNTADDVLGIADNDAYVYSEIGKSGIIIATGDVILRTSFTGMVISGGDIFLEGGASFTSSPTIVSNMIMKHTDICKYMNDLTASTEQQEDWKAINVSSLIVYENWMKN